MSELFDGKMKSLYKYFVLYEDEQQTFKYLFIFSFLYLFPLILSNFYYIDDVGRFANSEFNWLSDGRPLMQLMGKCFGFGKPYLDIFPLGQFLSALILNYSLVLWGRKNLNKEKPIIIAGYLALSYLNLFLLESFSYVYDSIGMTISFSIFLLLYAMPDNMRSKIKLVCSMCSVILSLSFYQASLGAYIGLAGIELALINKKSKQIRKSIVQCSIRALGFLLGALIYYFVIAGHFLKGYGIEHSSLLNLTTYVGMEQFIDHILMYIDRYKIYVHSLHKGILGILIFVYIGGAFTFIQTIKKTENIFLNKMGLILFMVTQPISIAFFSIGMFAILQRPVYAPRVFISFTVIFLYFSVLLNELSEKKKYVNLVLFPLLIFVLSFSAGYGNLLYREDRHDRQIAQSIVYDINQVERKMNIRFYNVTIIGRMPESLELSRQKRKRPLMADLVPIHMNSDWYWGGRYLDHYRNIPIQLIPATAEDKVWIHEREPDTENEFYKLYRKDNKIIINFCHKR